MTITHPRDFPDTVLAECSLTYSDGFVAARHSNGRQMALSQITDPLWIGRFSTGEMLPARRATWEAWHSSLAGRPFLAWDISKAEPLAYPNGHPAIIAATWNGTATVTALTQTTVALSGLPAAYQFTAGDRIGLVQSGRYGYFNVLESVTASGGGAATVTVAPFVNPATSAIFTTSAQAVIRRPKLLMQMVAGSWSVPVNAYAATATFEAVQIL